MSSEFICYQKSLSTNLGVGYPKRRPNPICVMLSDVHAPSDPGFLKHVRKHQLEGRIYLDFEIERRCFHFDRRIDTSMTMKISFSFTY